VSSTSWAAKGPYATPCSAALVTAATPAPNTPPPATSAMHVRLSPPAAAPEAKDPAAADVAAAVQPAGLQWASNATAIADRASSQRSDSPAMRPCASPRSPATAATLTPALSTLTAGTLQSASAPKGVTVLARSAVPHPAGMPMLNAPATEGLAIRDPASKDSAAAAEDLNAEGSAPNAEGSAPNADAGEGAYDAADASEPPLHRVAVREGPAAAAAPSPSHPALTAMQMTVMITMPAGSILMARTRLRWPCMEETALATSQDDMHAGARTSAGALTSASQTPPLAHTSSAAALQLSALLVHIEYKLHACLSAGADSRKSCGICSMRMTYDHFLQES
jgi:hypothetical protein